MTRQGASAVVSSGDVLFTLVGLCGLYFVLGLLYLFLVGREVHHGPHPEVDGHSPYGDLPEVSGG
jgi:cytochrome d ubiquinol oxidase subunit I